MCGIFGLQVLKKKNPFLIKEYVNFLLEKSEERGKDASGIYIKDQQEDFLLKKPINGTKLSQSEEYKSLFKKILNSNGPLINALGQCRLATNGKIYIDKFNQPIFDDSIILVHNGIILNDVELLKKYEINFKDISNESDSFNLVKLISALQKKFNNYNFVFEELKKYITGSFSLAFLEKSTNKIFFISNFGSIYFYNNNDFLIFASEKKTIDIFLKKFKFKFTPQDIRKAEINKLYEFEKISLNRDEISNSNKKHLGYKNFSDTESKIRNLKRCKNCILPQTYPFIHFNNDGICNYCTSYKERKLKNNLDKIFDQIRSKDGSPDCLVGLSGGRDSCYGLHLLKRKYNMNPIAYTYDWGLTTDKSRRNQALMVGKLGVEHIIRSANIEFKRASIQKNINAWLKRPVLGMVPIFMAGDKDFYQLGRVLKKELNVKLNIFCSGHEEEQRNFFIGFCGVRENLEYTSRLYEYPFNVKLKLATFYCLNFILNPRYINQSFFDSIKSFFTSFILKDDFLYLFEYLDWNENEIKETLKNEYEWEEDVYYGKNQWRMGDGQTAFTNYIFRQLAGFTEFDDFRSTQIRKGKITRDEALDLIDLDNAPKYEVLENFSSNIGLNLESVLSKINDIKKIF